MNERAVTEYVAQRMRDNPKTDPASMGSISYSLRQDIDDLVQWRVDDELLYFADLDAVAKRGRVRR